MSINYPQLADLLREELRQFFRVVRHTNDEDLHCTAVARLWTTIKNVEEFSYAPGDEEWSTLSESQRWAYLRIESYIGTALHELRRLQRAVWRGQDNHPAPGGTSEESHHA